MRVVIDTNRLASDELCSFLEMSPEHVAVLTHQVAAETFSGDAVRNVIANMAVLRNYPRQAVMLRPMAQIVSLDHAPAALGNRMIDRGHTRSIPTFLKMLDTADYPGIEKQLRQRGRWAVDQLSKMLGTTDAGRQAISEIEATFGLADLKSIRTGGPWSAGAKRRILDLAVGAASVIFEDYPLLTPKSGRANRWDHPLYRLGLCHALHYVLLLRTGAKERRPAVVRNDNIDLTLATLATYFNGLMTEDQHLNEVHILSTGILRAIGARVPIDYTAWVLTLD